MNDFWMFIGIFVLIFAVWIGTGGPSRPLSFSGPYLNPITETGTAAAPYGNPDEYHSVQGTSWFGLGGGSGTSNTTTTTENDSPFKGMVTLSRDASGAKQTDVKKEYVSIQLGIQAEEPVSTLGWKLVSKETKKGTAFPQGAELPKSSGTNQLAAMTLRPGDQAIVVTGRSPAGVSFRENICTGYLEEQQDFAPQLSLSCPTPSEEFSRFYNGNDKNDACVSYVRTIPYCSTKSVGSSKPSSACGDFTDRYLNYNGCVNTHRNDTQFYSGTWRIFLGSQSELWRSSRETILLLDASGKTIDTLTY